MNVLIINAGSSSLKYQLMNPETGDVSAKGLCERIYIDGRLTHNAHGKKVVKDIPMPTHSEAIEAVLAILVDPVDGVIKSTDEIDAVGHRVLHGGMEFFDSCIINDEVIAAIEKCIPLGPLHNPANLMGIRACQAVMPKTPQVAVFDTAFHMTMPPVAYRYAIPTEYYQNDSIRRYGFHGTSHKYVTKRAIELMGTKDIKLVNCHLGNGSSLSAVKDGKCQDTSMGLTPLAGVPMGTRSGDLDPAVVQFVMNKYGMSADECLNMLNKKSGVLALSVYRLLCRRSGRSGLPGVHRRRGRELRLHAGPDLLRSGIPGREAGSRKEQHPRQGGHHLRRRLQGHCLGHPHQRGTDDRAGYRRAGQRRKVILLHVQSRRGKRRLFFRKGGYS